MFGLSFLSPAFLLGALAAALPIALHLAGRRPHLRVSFPAVRLLKRTPADEIRRRRLRDLVLLALRVSAILLLALAFARPYFAAAVAPPTASAVLIAVDRSFSMTAPGQFQRAISLARSALARVPPGATVGLLAFDDDAEVVVRPGPDRGVVLKALAQLQPGYGGTSYGAALTRAAEALGSARGQVIVITDLQRHGWDRRDAAIPDRLDVSVEDTGGPAGNLSVTDLRRTDNGVTAVVQNSGPGRRTGRATLTVAGHNRGVAPFALEAGDARELLFPGNFPAAGEAAVEIDDPVGYQADNKTYGLLDPPDAPILLAIGGDGDPSRGAFYLQRALQVDDGRLFRVDIDAPAHFSQSAGADLKKYAAVLVLGTRGLRSAAAQAIGAYVAAGGGALVTLDDQVDASSFSQIAGTPLSFAFETTREPDSVGLLAADARHPILQPFAADAFGAAHFARIARIDSPPGDVLARFADGRAAIVEVHHGAGRLLLFASDLENRWNDLPLQPAFLPLVHQIARYLVGQRMPARDLLVSAVPPGVPRRPGIAFIGASGAATAPRRVVVNVDPRESDVSRMTAAEFEQVIARSRGTRPRGATSDPREAEQQQGLWRLAVAIAIAALLAETLLSRANSAQANYRLPSTNYRPEHD